MLNTTVSELILEDGDWLNLIPSVMGLLIIVAIYSFGFMTLMDTAKAKHLMFVVIGAVLGIGIIILLVMGLKEEADQQVSAQKTNVDRATVWLEENYGITLTEDSVKDLIAGPQREIPALTSDVSLDDGRTVVLQRSQETDQWLLYEVVGEKLIAIDSINHETGSEEVPQG
jgi:uncharacterized membrane protein